MAPSLVLRIGAHQPIRLAAFWAGMLGREIVRSAEGQLLISGDCQLDLRFVPTTQPRAGPERMHLHLASTTQADQERTVARALELGAAHLDVGQRPEEGHAVLADPEGNAFCVIEPGNAFLAGCGFLGELACDGGREVGVFWSSALGWPLVWDQSEETAIQAPGGGTKISWGGPPSAPHTQRNRQELEIIASDGEQAGEVDRLICLGATRLEGVGEGAVLLTDPEGNAFRVTDARTW